jgi:hypothetical protein
LWFATTEILDNSTQQLTFKTDRPLLGSEACQALATGRNFTVSLSTPDGLREITGKVLSVEPVDHVKPAQWEIVLRVTKERARWTGVLLGISPDEQARRYLDTFSYRA